MTLLAERYRRLLRLLPASYRQEWEEDMVATFLDGAHVAAAAAARDDEEAEEVEYGSPGWAEVASVVALAVRLRLGGPAAPPRYFAWGEAVRRVALVGLLFHAATGVAGIATTLWIAAGLPGFAVPDGVATGLPKDWDGAAWRLADLLWLPVYLALVHGQPRTARLLAPLALAPLVVWTVADLLDHGGAFAVSRSYWLLLAALPALALAAFHREAPPVEPRPWLVALPVGSAVGFLALLAVQPFGDGAVLDWPGLCALALVVAAAVHVLAPAARQQDRPVRWSLALALLAAGVLGLRVLTLLDYAQRAAPVPYRSAVLALGVVETAAVLAAGATLAVLAARRLRQESAAQAG